MPPSSSTRAVAVAIAAVILVGGVAAPAAAALSSDGAALTQSVGAASVSAIDDGTATGEELDGENATSDADTDDGDGTGTDTTDELSDAETTDEPPDENATAPSLEDAVDEADADDLEDANEPGSAVDEPSETAASIDDATTGLETETETSTESDIETTSALETATETAEDLETELEAESDGETTDALAPTRLETLAVNASIDAAVATGESDGSAARSASDSDATASGGAGADDSQSGDGTTDESKPDPAAGGETASDALLVGLLGAITASSAAAGAGASSGAGAGAGAGGTATNWVRSSSVSLGRLREIGSLLPWKWLSILGYSRYDDSDPLENEHRREIYDLIRDEPGCYLSEVGDRCDVSLSTVRHHVRVLEEEGLIASAAVDGKRRYVASEDADDAELHAALAQPAKREVLEALADLGPAKNGTLADELDRDPSTVSHHLSSLEDDGLVVRERDGRSVVTELAPGVETALRSDGAPLEDESTEPSASVPADD